MFELGILACVAGVVLSDTHEEVSFFYTASGIYLSLIMFMHGLNLAGLIQAISSVMGGIAIILFGGGLPER